MCRVGMSDEGVYAFCVCLFTLLGVELNGGQSFSHTIHKALRRSRQRYLYNTSRNYTENRNIPTESVVYFTESHEGEKQDQLMHIPTAVNIQTTPTLRD